MQDEISKLNNLDKKLSDIRSMYGIKQPPAEEAKPKASRPGVQARESARPEPTSAPLDPIERKLAQVRSLYRARQLQEAHALALEAQQEEPGNPKVLEALKLVERALERAGLGASSDYAPPAAGDGAGESSSPDSEIPRSVRPIEEPQGERPLLISIVGWFGTFGSLLGIGASFLLLSMSSQIPMSMTGEQAELMAGMMGVVRVAAMIALVICAVQMVCYWNLLSGQAWSYYLYLGVSAFSLFMHMIGKQKKPGGIYGVILEVAFCVYLISSPRVKRFFRVNF